MPPSRPLPAGIDALRTIAASGAAGSVYFGIEPNDDTIASDAAAAAVAAFDRLSPRKQADTAALLSTRMGLRRFMLTAGSGGMR